MTQTNETDARKIECLVKFIIKLKMTGLNCRVKEYVVRPKKYQNIKTYIKSYLYKKLLKAAKS